MKHTHTHIKYIIMNECGKMLLYTSVDKTNKQTKTFKFKIVVVS